MIAEGSNCLKSCALIGASSLEELTDDLSSEVYTFHGFISVFDTCEVLTNVFYGLRTSPAVVRENLRFSFAEQA